MLAGHFLVLDGTQRCLAEQFLEPIKVRKVRRLWEVIVKPSIPGEPDEWFADVRGQRDEFCVLEFGLRTQFSGECVTIHPRHCEVQEQAVRMVIACQSEPGFAIVRDSTIMTPHPKEHAQSISGVRIVVYDQDVKCTGGAL